MWPQESFSLYNSQYVKHKNHAIGTFDVRILRYTGGYLVPCLKPYVASLDDWIFFPRID